jgi:hypothetical protein
MNHPPAIEHAQNLRVYLRIVILRIPLPDTRIYEVSKCVA